MIRIAMDDYLSRTENKNGWHAAPGCLSYPALGAYICSPSAFAFYLAQDPGFWNIPLAQAL